MFSLEAVPITHGIRTSKLVKTIIMPATPAEIHNKKKFPYTSIRKERIGNLLMNASISACHLH
jgi:hypothetical protein